MEQFTNLPVIEDIASVSEIDADVEMNSDLPQNSLLFLGGSAPTPAQKTETVEEIPLAKRSTAEKLRKEINGDHVRIFRGSELVAEYFKSLNAWAELRWNTEIELEEED